MHANINLPFFKVPNCIIKHWSLHQKAQMIYTQNKTILILYTTLGWKPKMKVTTQTIEP